MNARDEGVAEGRFEIEQLSVKADSIASEDYTRKSKKIRYVAYKNKSLQAKKLFLKKNKLQDEGLHKDRLV